MLLTGQAKRPNPNGRKENSMDDMNAPEIIERLLQRIAELESQLAEKS
jgi:hypothetical protein